MTTWQRSGPTPRLLACAERGIASRDAVQEDRDTYTRHLSPADIDEIVRALTKLRDASTTTPRSADARCR